LTAPARDRRPLWISRTGEQRSVRSITKLVTKVMAAADVRTAHGLRHTLATRRVRDPGRDLALLADVLGRADAKTTCRYVAPSSSAEAGGRWRPEPPTGAMGRGLGGRIKSARNRHSGLAIRFNRHASTRSLGPLGRTRGAPWPGGQGAPTCRMRVSGGNGALRSAVSSFCQRKSAAAVDHDRAARASTQFLVATRSPVLLAGPDARIYELHDSGLVVCAYDQVDAVKLTRRFSANPTASFEPQSTALAHVSPSTRRRLSLLVSMKEEGLSTGFVVGR
jgi:hypothetical protein